MERAQIKPTPIEGSDKPRRIGYPGEPGRLLPAEGAEVPLTKFWVKKLMCGEVQRIDGEG